MKITSMMPAEPGYRAVFEIDNDMGECVEVKAWASIETFDEDGDEVTEILPVVWTGAGMTLATDAAPAFVGVLAPGDDMKEETGLTPSPLDQDEDRGPTGGFDA